MTNIKRTSRSKKRINADKTGKKKSKIKKNKSSKNIRKKKSINEYSDYSIKEAFEAVKEGMSLRGAAEKYGVPKSTLHWRLSHNSLQSTRKGPKTVLTQEEEGEIVNWILECHERGFPVTKSRLLDSVQKFIVNCKRDSPFKNSRPGKHWYEAFIRRNPILSERVAQNLTSTRASVTENELRGWFSYVKERLEKQNLLNIDSNRVFNLDESAFKLVPEGDKVIAKKSARNVYRIVRCSEKTTVTVLFTASAAGVFAPPMILFELKTAPKRSTLQWIPKGWGVGNSEGGWMTGESFYSYIKNIFYKWLVDNKYTFPVLLYVDNHTSHVNLQLLKFCKEKGIEIIALYPNSTHILQPLDVAFFHPLKVKYKEAVVKYKLQNEIIDFKKCMVAPVLHMAIDSMDFREGIIHGFQSSGLYPFDPESVSYNIFKKKNKKKTFVNAADMIPHNTQEKNKVDNNSMLLNFFESNVSADILEAFRRDELTGTWTGDSSQRALFEMWLKMRKLREKQSNEVEKHSVSNDYIQNNLISNTGASMENATEDSVFESDSLDLIQENVVDSYASTTMPDEIQLEDTWDSGILANLSDNCSSSEIEFFDEHGNKRTAAIIQVIPEPESHANSNDLISKPGVEILTQQNADEEILSLEKIDENNSNESENRKTSCTVTSNQVLSSSEFYDPQIIESISSDNVSNIINTIKELNVNNVIQTKNITVTTAPDLSAAKSSTNSSNETDVNVESTVPKTKHAEVLQEISLRQNKCIDPLPNQLTQHSKSTDELKKIFTVDKLPTKKKKKKNFEGTSAYFIDDMIETLEKKENEKVLKEQEMLLNKQKREKNKLMKAKELDINKALKEAKSKLLKQKKELNAEIKKLKSMIKAETLKENIEALKNKLENLISQLEETEKSINLHEMEALAHKLQIKKEKL